MRACASFGVSLVVRLGAMSVAFEGGIVSAGGLQYRQLPPAARPSARPTAVDALMDALDEQYEEDKSFTEMFDPAQSKVQCAFAFEVAARSVQTGRSDKGCRVQSSSKKKNPVKCTHTVDGLCIRFGRAKVEAALRASPAGQQMRGSSYLHDCMAPPVTGCSRPETAIFLLRFFFRFTIFTRAPSQTATPHANRARCSRARLLGTKLPRVANGDPRVPCLQCRALLSLYTRPFPSRS